MFSIHRTGSSVSWLLDISGNANHHHQNDRYISFYSINLCDLLNLIVVVTNRAGTSYQNLLGKFKKIILSDHFS